MGSDHQGEEFKGRAKEAAGDLTGDEDLQREGKVDQSSASAKRKISELADKVKGALTRRARRTNRPAEALALACTDRIVDAPPGPHGAVP